MDYYVMEETLQVLFEANIPLSKAQNTQLRQLCVGVLLAGSSHLSKIGRWLKQESQQDSRVQWIRRLLQANFMCQERVYAPFVKHALAHFSTTPLHLIMDRTPLVKGESDVLSVSLSYGKRAIPLVWQIMAHGMSDTPTQQSLLERCRPLLPPHCRVVFHGDNEFGSVRLMQYLHHLRWDFLVGQSSKNYYRCSPTGAWQLLSTLPVSKRHPVYLSKIEVTKAYGYGPINLFAFYQPTYSNDHHKHDITYCATSLPIAPTLRRVGQRRWGIECCFKDFKSSGWQLHLSALTHEKRLEAMLTVLSLAYLWTTCVGRWLCKTGNRQMVDAKAQRHLSLFRIGWDWLVHRYHMGLLCPALLTLYQ